MDNKLNEKIRNKDFLDKVVSAEEAASWIEDGMTIGMSGFTLFGEPKVFPQALANRGNNEDFKINLYMPYQGNAVQRKMINNGEISYIDQHLSHTAEQVRQGVLGDIDYAVIEAAAITDEGLIIPTGSVGNSPIFVQKADNVIIEL